MAPRRALGDGLIDTFALAVDIERLAAKGRQFASAVDHVQNRIRGSIGSPRAE
jgi:hypothetical protein